jgi:hypothetical protein
VFSLFDKDGDFKLKMLDYRLYPDRNLLEESLRTIVKQEDKRGVKNSNFFQARSKLVDADGITEITVDQLINKYLSNPEICFIKGWPEFNDHTVVIKETNEVVTENKRSYDKIFGDMIELCLLDHKKCMNKFIKFKDGDHKLLQFIPEKTTEEQVTYESQPDKPVNRYKFYVHDLSSESATEEEMEWASSESVAAEVLKWIEKGYCVMHITRKGSDIKTRYSIDPLID